MRPSLYRILGVPHDADPAAIAAAYAQLQAAFENGTVERSDNVMAREAFAVLSHPDKRARYDASLLPPPLVRADAASDASAGFRLDWRMAAAAAAVVAGLLFWWRSAGKSAPAPAAQSASFVSQQHLQQQPQERQPAPASVATALAQAPAPAAANLAGTGAAPLGLEALFAMLSPSVARINILDAAGRVAGSGSGVMIGGDAVITNCHVALGGPRLQVRIQDALLSAKVVVADEERDLCKLSVQGLNGPGVVIGSSDKVRTGQRVVAIGAPRGLDLTISDGIISSLRKTAGGTLIQTTAPVSPGSSGGGLFDDSGRLVGIVTFQYQAGQNLNFAAPAEWIADMRTRRGNGITGRVTTADEAEAPEARTNAEESEMVIGEWQCRDVIGGKLMMWVFSPNSAFQVIRDNKVLRGSWTFHQRHVSLQFANSREVLAVDEMSETKMVINAGNGERAVCTRQ